MKKVILSSIVAAAIATTATADMKIGVGTDVISGKQMLRVSLDGLVDGLRVEPRFAIANMDMAGTKDSMSAYGVGAYYNLSKTVSVGGFYDTKAKSDKGMLVTADTTTMAVALKAETDLGEKFSIAFEIGLENEEAGTTTVMQPYKAVTMRAWF